MNLETDTTATTAISYDLKPWVETRMGGNRVRNEKEGKKIEQCGMSKSTFQPVKETVDCVP